MASDSDIPTAWDSWLCFVLVVVADIKWGTEKVRNCCGLPVGLLLGDALRLQVLVGATGVNGRNGGI